MRRRRRKKRRNEQEEVEAGRRNVIGRARFVYLFAWGEAAENSAPLAHANRQLGYTLTPEVAARERACKISRLPSRRFVGNFYTQSNKVRANAPGVRRGACFMINVP